MVHIARRLSDHEWLEDLAYMVSTMKSTHPNLFHDISETEFDEVAAALANSISSMTDNEVLVGLLRLAALTGDWYTQLISRNLTERWFPVRMERLADGIFITAAFTSSDYMNLRDPVMEQVLETIRRA